MKRLSDRLMSVSDMRTEVEVLSALAHPHVVRVVGVFWEVRADRSEFLLLEELAAGGELLAWIGQRGRPLRPVEQARLTAQLLRGLGHLHALSLIHI